jgi:hypothetical protein
VRSAIPSPPPLEQHQITEDDVARFLEERKRAASELEEQVYDTEDRRPVLPFNHSHPSLKENAGFLHFFSSLEAEVLEALRNQSEMHVGLLAFLFSPS